MGTHRTHTVSKKQRTSIFGATTKPKPDAARKTSVRSGATSPKGQNVSLSADAVFPNETLASIIPTKGRAAEYASGSPPFHVLRHTGTTESASSPTMTETSSSSSRTMGPGMPRKQVWVSGIARNADFLKDKTRAPEPKPIEYESFSERQEAATKTDKKLGDAAFLTKTKKKQAAKEAEKKIEAARLLDEMCWMNKLQIKRRKSEWTRERDCNLTRS